MPAAPLRPLALLVAAALTACSTGLSIVGGPTPDAAEPTDLAADLGVDAPDVPAPIDIPDVPSPIDTPDVPRDTPPARCAADADCVGNAAGPTCNVASGQCVACTAASDRCPASQYCIAAMNRCADGCRDDAACAAASDGGTTTLHCDPTTHACLACLTDDHCPAGTLCTGHVCVVGCSASSDHCPTGQSCCGGACVDRQSNVAHCGACDHACSYPNAAPSCSGGACGFASCALPFADCDGLLANGCETDTSTALAHCGACGTPCATRPHATASCAAAACAYACDAGFADCDGNPANGCEVDTRSAVDHCGSCANACALPGATASCVAGACAVASCAAGRANCNGDPADGCESSSASDPLNCGACGNACPAVNGAARCYAGRCDATACAAILAADPTAPSGTYSLDLDGAGPNVARNYYCDMRDGGWTVVANQVPTELLADSVATLGAANFGDITHSWRLGNPDIRDVRPTLAWRLSDEANNVYVVRGCVVDWSINYLNMTATECTLGYTTTALNVLVNGRFTNCSARGIGINNNGASCSIRMSEGGFGLGVGAMANGRAYTCNYNTATRVSLAFR